VQTLGESGQAEREAVIKYGVESFSIQKLSFSGLLLPLSLHMAARPMNTGLKLREGCF
jgi:hypothetical protein